MVFSCRFPGVDAARCSQRDRAAKSRRLSRDHVDMLVNRGPQIVRNRAYLFELFGLEKSCAKAGNAIRHGDHPDGKK